MIVKPEQVKDTLKVGDELVRMCDRISNCVDETRDLMGMFNLGNANVDFPKLRDNIVAHLEMLTTALSGQFENLVTTFDSQFNVFFDLISSEGNYGDVDIDLVKEMKSWVPDDLPAYSMILIPHKVIAYINDHREYSTMRVEDIGPQCMARNEQAHSAAYVLLNTIITKRMMRDSGNQDVAETMLHAIKLKANCITGEGRQELFDLIELVKSPEFEQARINFERADAGDDSNAAKVGRKAVLETVPKAIDALIKFSTHLYAISVYAKFYSATLECIPNTSLIIDGAWKRYQEAQAVQF